MSDTSNEVLEERLKHLNGEMTQHRQDDKEEFEQINAKLDLLLQDRAKYKGVLGGLLLAASAVGAFISYALHYLGRG